MADSTCSAEDCSGKVAGRGMCAKHYRRWQKTQPGPECTVDGCTLKRYARGICTRHYDQQRYTDDWVPLTTKERFWAQVEKTQTCWNWTGTVNVRIGYGYYGNRRAHRMAYTWPVGPIPEGLHIDHTCFNRICVNPDHLRAVTQKQNNENHQGARSDSSTGIRGVWRCSKSGRWLAAVKVGDKLWSKRFDTIEQAEAAAIAKRNEVFTHNDLDRAESVA